MSRWSNWSRGENEKPRFLSGFIREALDTGNPAVGSSPAERARQLGLQSDGSGGYIDPETGQKVAATVNGELVFYDNRGLSGGAVADGGGGSELVNAQPTWSDPMTGLAITPPANPESPFEKGAIPDAIPASAPAGYDSFMNQSKMRMYDQQQQVNATHNVNNPMQAAPAAGINPIGAGGTVDQGPNMEMPGMSESTIGDNATMRDKIGDMPKPGKTFHDMRKELGKAAAAQWGRHVDEKKPRNDTKQSLLRKKFKPLTQALKGMEEGDARTQFMGSVLQAMQYGDYNNNASQLMSGPEVRGMGSNLSSLRDAYQEDDQGHFDISKAEEFVQSRRYLKGKIPQEIKDKAFDALPPRVTDRFTGGDIKKNKAGKKQGWDMYCDQGGNCGYTGQPLDLESFAVEHFVDNSRVQNGQATDEEAEFIQNPERGQFWSNKAPNSQKSSRSPAEFADIVEELNTRSDEYFDYQDNEVVPAKPNLKQEEVGLIGQGLLEDGKLREDLTDDKITAIKDLITEMYDGKKSALLEQLTSQHDPKGLLGIGDATAQKMLDDGELTEPDMEVRTLVRELASKVKGLSPEFGRRLVKGMGLTSGFRQSLRPRTGGLGHDSIYEGFARSVSHLPVEQRQEMLDKWQDAMATAGREGVRMAESGQRGLTDGNIGQATKSIFKKMAKEGKFFDEEVISQFPHVARFLENSVSEDLDPEMMQDESEPPMEMILMILQKLQELTQSPEDGIINR